jgi:hypothetical protein
MTPTVPVRPEKLLNVADLFRLRSGTILGVVSEGRFVAIVAGSVVVLFVVAFGLLDFEGPAADVDALLTLGFAWMLLGQHEASQ